MTTPPVRKIISLIPKWIDQFLLYGGDSPAIKKMIDDHNHERMVSIAKFTAVLFLTAVCLTWPSDYLIFANHPEIIRAFSIWRTVGAGASLAVLVIPFLTPSSMRNAATEFLLYAGSASLFLAGGYSAGMLGGLDKPFYYPVYGMVMLPTMMPMRLPARTAILLGFALCYDAAYFLPNPEHLNNPYLYSVLIMTGSSLFLTVTLGHLLFHTQRLNLLAQLELSEKARELDEEHQRSENLLLNILPSTIADQLKNHSGYIATGFENVTVLFADIVGFTPMSNNMKPVEVVRLLDEMFSEFDNLAEEHGLEKIKTIGDAYMAAAGLPTPDENHAHAVADMALEMISVAQRYNAPSGEKLNLRIGINSGSVVAGVIGRKKFIYDLWGDAVNTASRMESQGAEGEVQVTERTYNILKDDFELTYRDEIEIKGKGKMKTWWLGNRKSKAD